MKNEKKTWWQRRGWIAVGGGIVALIILLKITVDAGYSEGYSMPQTSTRLPTTANSVTETTGISQSDANGEAAVIGRYHISGVATGVVAKDAAEIYSMESSDKYGAILQQAGVGSLNNVADTLAHVVHAWNLSDTDVSHSLDVIFNGLTTSSISWNDYTSALITNGPKMRDYTSLVDAASELAGAQMTVDTSDAVSVFNTVGDSLEDPNSKLNLAMGGSGYIRTLVKQKGLLNTIEEISIFIRAHQ